MGGSTSIELISQFHSNVHHSLCAPQDPTPPVFQMENLVLPEQCFKHVSGEFPFNKQIKNTNNVTRRHSFFQQLGVFTMNMFSQPHIESRFKVSLLITYALHNMLSNLSLGIALLLAYCEGEAFGIAYTETSASLI